MIIAQKKAFLDGVNSISNDWLMFNFSGTEPTKESEFPFNVNDLNEYISNCQSVVEASSSLVNDKFIKFIHSNVLLPQKGMNPNGYGVVCKNLESNLSLSVEQTLGLMRGSEPTVNLPQVNNGDYLVVDLGYNIEVDSLVLKFGALANSPASFSVDYWDGNAWVQFGSIGTTSNTVHIFDCSQSTDKIRINFTSSSSSNVDFDLFRVIGTGVSTEPADESITWSIIVPKDFSSFDSLLNGTVPMFYCSTTGPNAGGDVIITNANPAKGEEVRLVVFTLKSETFAF